METNEKQGALSRFKARYRAARQFWDEGLWRQDLPPLWSWKGQGHRCLRILHLLVNGFKEGDIRLHAAALTYNTLIALVPLLGLSLAVLKGMGYDTEFQQFLLENTSEMPDQFRDYAQQAITAVQQANFARIGAVGALILIFVVVQMLGRAERAFNSIWSVNHQRPWLRHAANHIAIIVVVPILLIAALTLNAQFKFDGTLERLGLLRLVPFLAAWVGFAILYAAMPNTRVKIWPALVGGFVGAFCWHMWFRFYITVQPGVTRTNVIYGTLASVPIFLVWVQVNWTLVLLGGKVTYAVQNGSSYQPGGREHRANAQGRFHLALGILRQCVAAMSDERNAFFDDSFLQQHRVPRALLNRVLQILKEAGLIAETTSNKGHFVLLKLAEHIKIRDVFDLILEDGEGLNDMGVVHVDQTMNWPDYNDETDLASWCGSA